MKITKLELFKVPPRWLFFLKIETDEGISGWGEPVVEGKADTVAAAVKEMSGMLIGQDPMRIEDLWQTMYRGGFYRGGPILTSAISGIEQALWDIKGKYYNAPVYDLLAEPAGTRPVCTAGSAETARARWGKRRCARWRPVSPPSK